MQEIERSLPPSVNPLQTTTLTEIKERSDKIPTKGSIVGNGIIDLDTGKKKNFTTRNEIFQSKWS